MQPIHRATPVALAILSLLACLIGSALARCS